MPRQTVISGMPDSDSSVDCGLRVRLASIQPSELEAAVESEGFGGVEHVGVLGRRQCLVKQSFIARVTQLELRDQETPS